MAKRFKSKHRAPKNKRSFATALLVAGVALMLVAAGLWGYAQTQYAAQAANNKKLAQYVLISDNSETAPLVDWESLKAINDDIVGWIEVPGTKISYPVYQGESNDTYLHTTAEGEYSIGGQIFMDYENAAPGLVDRQTILYGHHLNNGDMFASIDDMCNQDYFDTITTVWYVTEDESYELAPLFIYKTPATSGEARQTAFASDEDFHEYLSGLLSKASALSSGADAALGRVTRVLSLCTCDYENDFGEGNGRSLLVCALKSEL